jgi:outer membrane protein TolC
MKKKVLVIIAVVISMQMYPQKILQLEECRQMAISHNKNLRMAEESIIAAREMKKAAFTQFLPNFSANGTYNYNSKNLSLLSENAMLPVYNLNANGSVNYASSWNNSWAVINGAPVPLDASGTPFNPSN